MSLRDDVEKWLFRVVYIPFAIVAIAYVIGFASTGDLIEAGLSPWWLGISAVPIAMILLVLGLGILDLDKFF